MPTCAIIGASGKVGFATSSALRKAGVTVRAILRDDTKVERLRSIGCEISIADLRNVASVAKAITHVDAVQIILPAVPTAEDPAEEMRTMMECVARAVGQARPARILTISDYGAHISRDIGMPGIFRMFEERLRRIDGVNKIFLRSAEHMENLARVIPPTIDSGALPSFHDPVDRQLPMICAPDLGLIAAELLLHSPHGENVTVVHAEGPHRYSDSDIAAALGEMIGKTIEVKLVPRSHWDHVLGQRLPSSLAELLVKTNDAHNEGSLIEIEPGSNDIRHGRTELKGALRNLLDK